MRVVIEWFRRRQRRIDCEVLLPSLFAAAPTYNAAKIAWLLHLSMNRKLWDDHLSEAIDAYGEYRVLHEAFTTGKPAHYSIGDADGR